jgi:hypothetical protein
MAKINENSNTFFSFSKVISCWEILKWEKLARFHLRLTAIILGEPFSNEYGVYQLAGSVSSAAKETSDKCLCSLHEFIMLIWQTCSKFELTVSEIFEDLNVVQRY